MTIESVEVQRIKCDNPDCGFAREVAPGDQRGTGVAPIEVGGSKLHFCIGCVQSAMHVLLQGKRDINGRRVLATVLSESELMLGNMEEFARKWEEVDELRELVAVCSVSESQ